jgi:Lon-like protease
MVLAEPVAAVAPNPKHRYWAVPMAVLPLIVLAAILLSSLYTASRFTTIKRPYAIVPSDAEQVESRLKLEQVPRYPAMGKILFVTIREPQLPLLSWLMFHDDDDIDTKTHDEIFGSSTQQQVAVRGQRQMISAQQSAEYAALSKLGYPIDLKAGDIVIDQIICFKIADDGKSCADEAPSGKVLESDDKLVSLDGVDIKTVDDLVSVLGKHKPDDEVEVKYERPGLDGVQTGTIQLIASPDDASRTIVGFYPFDTTTVGTAPFPIDLNFGGIGGPSAGLALTLTLIDELTPGELTGGNRIAVTGTIDINGKVGAIGGLAQKASAVRQAGAKYFIVPTDQSPESLADARVVVGNDVQIITVATLDEALAAMAKLGGNGNELGTPGKDYTPPS